MNNNKLNTDEFTKKLISKGDIQQPSSDFTRNVMSKILKNPAVKVSFITNDDKKSNLWLIISLGAMLGGLFLFYWVSYGFNFSEAETPVYLKAFADLFSKFWGELSLSPYILIALVGVIFLVLIDKTIVKYLHSI